MGSSTKRIVGVALVLAVPSVAPAQELKLRAELMGSGGMAHSVALSHDGKILVSVSPTGDRRDRRKREGDFRVWDVESGEALTSFLGHEEHVRFLALSPDGASLASADDSGTMLLWSVAEQRVTSSHRVPGHVSVLTFSADGKKLGAASSDTVLACDTATGAAVTSVSRHGRWQALAFAPDLAFLAAGCHQDVDLQETATGKLRRTLPDHHGTVSGLAFGRDGKTLAVDVSRDDEELGYHSEVVLWDVATGTERACFKGIGYCRALALDTDRNRLVMVTEKEFNLEIYDLKVIDATTGKVTSSLRFKRGQMPLYLAMSGDGTTAAVGCADGCVRVFDLP
jgi:WD40 repeat protein